MATPYTNQFSSFPDYLIGEMESNSEMHFKMPETFVDVDSSSSIIEEIERLRSTGNPEDYQRAAMLIKNNKNILQGRIIDSNIINAFVEEIRNTQVMSLQKKQFIYVQDIRPAAAGIHDVWIAPAQKLDHA